MKGKLLFLHKLVFLMFILVSAVPRLVQNIPVVVCELLKLYPASILRKDQMDVKLR